MATKATEDAVQTLPESGGTPLTVTREVDEDGKQEAYASAHTTEVDVYLVQIERSNNEKISAEVYEFEIPVLEFVHGESAVIASDEPEFSVQMEGDANDVLRMLRGKYNSPQIGDVVSKVYRDAGELASKAGFDKPKGKAKAAPASENVDNRKKKK